MVSGHRFVEQQNPTLGTSRQLKGLEELINKGDKWEDCE